MEVIGIFKNEIYTRQRLKKPEKLKLRVLRSDQAFQASLVSVDEIDEENVLDISRTDLRAAMLEAEHKKGEALAAFQYNRHHLC